MTDRPEADFPITIHPTLFHASTRAKVLPGAFAGRDYTSAKSAYGVWAVLVKKFGSDTSYPLSDVVDEYARISGLVHKSAYLILQRGSGLFWDVIPNKSAGIHKIDYIPAGRQRRPSKVIVFCDLAEACRRFDMREITDVRDMVQDNAKTFLSGSYAWPYQVSLRHLRSQREENVYQAEMARIFGICSRTIRKYDKQLGLRKERTHELLDLATPGAYSDKTTVERAAYLESMPQDDCAFLLSQELLYGRFDKSTEAGRKQYYRGNPKFRGAFARNGEILLNSSVFTFINQKPKRFAARIKRGANNYPDMPLKSRRTLDTKNCDDYSGNERKLWYVGTWRGEELWSVPLSHVAPMKDPLRGMYQGCSISTNGNQYLHGVRTAANKFDYDYELRFRVRSTYETKDLEPHEVVLDEGSNFVEDHEVLLDDDELKTYADGSCNYTYVDATDGEPIGLWEALTHSNIFKLPAEQYYMAWLVRTKYALLRTGLESLSELGYNIMMVSDRKFGSRAVDTMTAIGYCHKLLWHDRFTDTLEELVGDMKVFKSLKEIHPTSNHETLIEKLHGQTDPEYQRLT